ncbi:hypothetical protein QFC19_000039 [Naganishia cerealis]|uniref:Uncharacterized protein n=1 Tax=Naganishia cerealis TaxID=610337 RepID=A0ACC2WSQ4_9TREE|nr:hypothetical protein QFC19_000039 [Naganishia cerealis]
MGAPSFLQRREHEASCNASSYLHQTNAKRQMGSTPALRLHHNADDKLSRHPSGGSAHGHYDTLWALDTGEVPRHWKVGQVEYSAGAEVLTMSRKYTTRMLVRSTRSAANGADTRVLPYLVVPLLGDDVDEEEMATVVHERSGREWGDSSNRAMDGSRILPRTNNNVELEEFTLDSRNIHIKLKGYADLVEATVGMLAVELPHAAVDILRVQDLCPRFGVIFPGVDDSLARCLRHLSLPHFSPPKVFYLPLMVVERQLYEILGFAFIDSRFLSFCVALWYDEVEMTGTCWRWGYGLEKTGKALMAYLIGLWIYTNMPQEFTEGDLTWVFSLIAGNLMGGAISKDLIGPKAWFLRAEEESDGEILCPTAREVRIR